MALFDCDGKGRLAIYLLNNGGPKGRPNQLYLQRPDGTFANASRGSGLDFSDWCMGVAVGDVNNDGLPDLLVTAVGGVRLLREPAMATVRDILAVKGAHVLSIGPEASVLDAALLMNEHKIGSLLVMSGGCLVGILTERDILERVVAPCRHPAQTPVQEAMTTEVACCQPHTSIDEARGVMKNRRIRHLPVVDDDRRLHGLISIGDLNAHQAHDHEYTIHVLQEYIYGRV